MVLNCLNYNFLYKYYVQCLRSVHVIVIPLIQNQENYVLITQFNPLKLAIFDQKRTKNGLKYPKFPIFHMVPLNRWTRTLLARLPAKHLNSVPVNINIWLFGTAA